MDWEDYSEPEKGSGSRMANFQHRIATALIRPSSAKTGEQRLRLQYRQSTINPDTFSKSIDEDARVNAWRETAMPKAWDQVNMWDRHIHAAESQFASESRDNPDVEGWTRTGLDAVNRERRKAVAHLDQVSAPLTPSQTSRHITLAALLGKKAVGYALSDQNPAMNNHKNFSSYSQYETDDGPQGIHYAKDLGEAKATHAINTRTLSRGKRLLEKVAPYRAVVHEMSDAYGGAEEGGWTYETGEAVHTSRNYLTQRGAIKEAKRLETKYTRNKRGILNMSASDVYQMDQDEGVFDPIEYTDNAALVNGLPHRFMQEPDDEDYDYSHFGRPSKDHRVTVAYGNIGDFPKTRPQYE